MSFFDIEKSSANNYFHSMKDQFQRLVYGRSEEVFAAGDAARDKITNMKQLEERRKLIRKTFISSIGGLPSMNTPLKSKVVGSIQEKGFRIEKIIYEPRPNALVTANLYIPDGLRKPTGAVLFVCGHNQQAKHASEYQIVCRHLVNAGLIVLAQDPIGQGELFSYYEKALKNTTVNWGTGEHDHVGAQCVVLGDSIARYFVHDAMRGIDYLSSRPEVDAKRIGVTGNSGGGTQTSMMMMEDPRIAAAAPATFIMNRRTYMYSGGAQDAEQIWPGMTAKGFDHEDILLPMCPKPVCVLAVTYDFFPIEGTRQTVERCRRFWELSGKAGNLEIVEDTSKHAYTPKLARAAARFFSQHLLDKKINVNSDAIEAIEPSKLWCTPSGQVKEDRTGIRFVFEENQDRLSEFEALRKNYPVERGKESALRWLKEQILFNRRPTNLNPRFWKSREEEFCVENGYWWSQKEVINEGVLFRNFRFAEKKLPVTLAVWNDGTTAIRQHLGWLRKTCESGRAVLVLNVTGVGGSEPNPLNAVAPHAPYGVMHKLNDDLMWLGDSICAMRAYDVLRTLEALRQWPGVDAKDLRVYAHGAQGVYAELAAAVEPGLGSIELHEEFEGFGAWVKARHYDVYGSRSLLLPGVLRHLDLPDLRKWRGKHYLKN
jgi:hypothetical protein